MVIVRTPAPDSRRVHLLWQVLDLLATNGVKLDLTDAAGPGDAETLARAAVANGSRMVVVAGGDDIVLEVAQALIGSDVRLGIIPIGSTNRTAHALGLPFRPRAVAAALAFGRTRPFWPGLVTGTEVRRLFVQAVGIGFDAHVVRCFPSTLWRMCGKGAYAMQSLRGMRQYEFRPMQLWIDGMQTRTISAIISKEHIGGTLDDDRGRLGFSVTLIDRGGPCSMLLYSAAHAIRLLKRAPGVRHLRAQMIVVSDNQRLPAHMDGQFTGYTPLSVAEVSTPLWVVVT